MSQPTIKEMLFNHCIEYVNMHIETNQKAIEQAQDAASSETRTIASEEPETGKERMQREVETFGRRLEEVLEEREVLQSIPYNQTLSCVEPGALVETSVGTFFISMSADEVEIDGIEYCPISMVSPIGQAIQGKKAGDVASFRGKTITIENVN